VFLGSIISVRERKCRAECKGRTENRTWLSIFKDLLSTNEGAILVVTVRHKQARQGYIDGCLMAL
jgi:hypothetical protein